MWYRRLLGVLFVVAGLAALLLNTVPARAQAEEGDVIVLTASGPVTPALKSYLERGLKEARATGAQLVILRLDTPGGSVEVMGEIVKVLDNADVPVTVYVWPSGGRAASAGTFIVLAAHFAAMAPRTTIGAASPVAGEGQEIPETLSRKITNDLVASIKSHAARRGPKAVEWAEKAVREAVSANETEALEVGIIDAIATDIPDLLRQLDGRQAEVRGRTVTLELSGASVRELDMTPIEQFLHLLANPNIALLLLSLGGTAIIIELYSPGGYAAGIFGVIALLLGFYALGVLEANYAGLALIALAFALFLMEALTPSVGIFALGGVIAFVLGAFMLFDTSFLAVSKTLVITVALVLGGFFAFAIGAALKERRRQPLTGREGLVGQVGEVRARIDPEGMVLVRGERWVAISPHAPLEPGTKVRVVSVDQMRLVVEPVELAESPVPAKHPAEEHTQ